MKDLKTKMSDYVVKLFLHDEALWINKISLIESVGYFCIITCMGLLLMVHYNVDKTVIQNNLSDIIASICGIIFFTCCTIIFIEVKKKKTEQTFGDIIREIIHEDINGQLNCDDTEKLNDLIKKNCELYLIKKRECGNLKQIEEQLSEENFEYICKDVKVKFNNSRRKIGPFWIVFSLWLIVMIASIYM